MDRQSVTLTHYTTRARTSNAASPRKCLRTNSKRSCTYSRARLRSSLATVCDGTTVLIVRKTMDPDGPALSTTGTYRTGKEPPTKGVYYTGWAEPEAARGSMLLG